MAKKVERAEKGAGTESCTGKFRAGRQKPALGTMAAAHPCGYARDERHLPGTPRPSNQSCAPSICAECRAKGLGPCRPVPAPLRKGAESGRPGGVVPRHDTGARRAARKRPVVMPAADCPRLQARDSSKCFRPAALCPYARRDARLVLRPVVTAPGCAECGQPGRAEPHRRHDCARPPPKNPTLGPQSASQDAPPRVRLAHLRPAPIPAARDARNP